MATESNTTGLSGSLSVGARVLRGLLTAAVGGSVVLGGNLYFDKEQTTTHAPSIVVGTGSKLSFTGAKLAYTGSALAPTRMSACVKNPYTTTGTVVYAQMTCANTYRAAVTSDAGVVASTTLGTGSNLWNNKPGFGTGNTSINGTGAVQVPVSQFVCVYTSTGAAPEADCRFDVDFRENYRP